MTQDEWSLAFFNQTMRVLLLCLVIVFVSCTPRGVREAQEVVALADSLREAHLVAQDEYNDSTHLAQAYYTLEKWQWLYPDDFAHACYHYGRILRDKDNPVAAMQVFLAATHSRTHDYHILARTYSNIGDICRLGEAYDLAYCVYQHAINNFILCDDSIMSYFTQNNQAYVLAEKGDVVNSVSLLDSIAKKCPSLPYLQMAITETRAIAYLKAHQYDSVLLYATQLITYDTTYNLAYVIKAQAFSFIDNADSATYYAYKGLNNSANIYNQANLYYILTNQDDEKDITTVREYSAKRADTQKLIEIRQGKLSQAVQLLKQDLTRKPERRWLYAIIVTILVLGIVNGCLVYKKRKRHQLLSQQIEDLESKNKSVISQLRIRIDSNIALLSKSHNLKKDLHWDNFELFCQEVNQQFNMLATKLQAQQVLNETQIRLCILVLLNLSRSSIAETQPYAINSIGKLKDQTAKLLGTTGKNLRTYLLQLAIEG